MRPKCPTNARLVEQPNSSAWMLLAVSVCVVVCWCVLIGVLVFVLVCVWFAAPFDLKRGRLNF